MRGTHVCDARCPVIEGWRYYAEWVGGGRIGLWEWMSRMGGARSDVSCNERNADTIDEASCTTGRKANG
ncbi:MAG: hypothetical protein NPIRA05_21780 [Nitrospirales bacterium]|nr:MAG: hypothetical protein NPIRA05_21780 [Nitrospirales bacterium]